MMAGHCALLGVVCALVVGCAMPATTPLSKAQPAGDVVRALETAISYAERGTKFNRNSCRYVIAPTADGWRISFTPLLRAPDADFVITVTRDGDLRSYSP
jgi:hypothetical protein